MRIPILKRFLLLELFQCDDHWWVTVAELQLDDFNGSLFHVESDNGYWEFDFLYLRTLTHKLKDWWEQDG